MASFLFSVLHFIQMRKSLVPCCFMKVCYIWRMWRRLISCRMYRKSITIRCILPFLTHSFTCSLHKCLNVYPEVPEVNDKIWYYITYCLLGNNFKLTEKFQDRRKSANISFTQIHQLWIFCLTLSLYISTCLYVCTFFPLLYILKV